MGQLIGEHTMATAVNRKRKHKREANDRSLWGFLFHPSPEGENLMQRTLFSHEPEDEDEEEEQQGPLTFHSLLLRFRRTVNLWVLVSAGLFLSFTALLLLLLIKMWIPQDLRDIAGYDDNAAARDLAAIIRNANGEPVTITEAELNRYLRETCRMRQTGLFSIITHCQGVAARIHNGYLELVFDRIMGANMHQTTAVNLTFSQESKLGTPVLHVDFQGGEPLFGAMPKGGSIGSIPIPQRHVLMLKPAVESLLTCYPDITEQIREHHYCPVFADGGSADKRHLTLIPYSPSN